MAQRSFLAVRAVPLHFEPAALAVGLRVTASALVPLIIGRTLGQPSLALMITLGGLNVATTDPGGRYRTRAIGMYGATLGVALSVWCGTLAGNSAFAAVALMFVWAFAGGFAGIYGVTVSKASFSAVVIFLISLGLPAGPGDASIRFVACACGGVWAMLLSLWRWPFQPYQPLRAAVANYYRALQAFLDEAGRIGIELAGSTPGQQAKRLAQKHAVVATADSQLRPFLEAARASEHRSGQRLVLLAIVAAAVFDDTVRLVEELDIATGFGSYAQIQSFVTGAVQHLARVAGSIAQKIGEGKADAIDVRELRGQCIAVGEKVTELREGSPDLAEEYAYIVDLRNVARTLESLATSIARAAELVHTQNPAISADPVALPDSPFRHLTLSAITEPIRANLTIYSRDFRHAVRLGLMTAFAVAFYSALHIEHGVWITLTIAVILKPDFGLTFQRAVYRVAGTVAGGIVAALLAATLQSDVPIYLLMIALGILAYAQIQYNYGLFTLLLTPFVVLLLNLSVPGDWQVAFVRIANTFIGGCFALAASYVLLPTWQRSFLPTQLARTLKANLAYFESVMAIYLGQKTDAVAIQRFSAKAQRETASAESALQSLLGDPKRQQGNFTDIYRALVADNRHFCDGVTTLAAHLEHFSGQHSLPALAEIAHEITASTTHLAEYVEQGRRPGEVSAQLGAHLDEFQAVLHTLTERRITELAHHQIETRNRAVMLDFAIVGRELERLAQDVTDMYVYQNQVSS